MSIEARFYVAEFNEKAAGMQADGTVKTWASVVLNAVTRKMGEDNVQWSEYSPAGQMTISVTQKEGGAYDAFRELLGKDVRILIDEIKPDA